MFLKIIFTSFAFLMAVSFQGLEASGTGYLLILHGSPCAGKSTLAQELQHSLGFSVVKKTPFSLKLKADYIEEQTGVRPESMPEILEQWVLLSPPNDVQKAVQIETWRLTFQAIRELVRQGNRVVLDTCLSKPFDYDSGQEQELGEDPLGDSRVIYVLLHAPLSSLFERVCARTEGWNRSPLLDQRSRSAVLSRFHTYYTPVLDHKTEPLDWVDASTVWQFDVPHHELLFPNLKKNIDVLIREWFSENESISIKPRFHEDLVLNTENLTVVEEAQAIKEFLEKYSECGVPTLLLQ